MHEMRYPPKIGGHVVVHGFDSRVYVGELLAWNIDENSGAEDVVLGTVMEFAMSMGPQGMGQALKAPDFADGPLEELVVKPAAMYAVSQLSEDVQKKVLGIAQQARAQKAGIHLATSIPNGPRDH